MKKENLPTKTCVVCDRPFTWRKKWERCWDEVTTCSKSCNAARRREKQSGASGADESGASDDGEASDVDVIPSSPRGEGGDAKDAKRDARKAAKRAAKAAKRAKRAGEDGGAGGSKPCDGCDKASDLLVRCQVDESKRWQMLCGACWKRASGGVTDGDADHPHYRYGGLWKNRRAQKGGAKDDAGEDVASGLEELELA